MKQCSAVVMRPPVTALRLGPRYPHVLRMQHLASSKPGPCSGAPLHLLLPAEAKPRLCYKVRMAPVWSPHRCREIPDCHIPLPVLEVPQRMAESREVHRLPGPQTLRSALLGSMSGASLEKGGYFTLGSRCQVGSKMTQ